MDNPRVVTFREAYDRLYGDMHTSCMRIACQEAKQMVEEFKIPIENFNISAICFQHYQCMKNHSEYIKKKQEELQLEVDKRFKK